MEEKKPEKKTILHVVTPFYRYENFGEIYNSLKDYPNIIWHLGISKHKPLHHNVKNEKIKIHEIECDDSQAWLKRRNVLETIYDGYFCFLDDDSIFHEGMYKKFLEISELNYEGLVVGYQLTHDGRVRLKPSIPIYCKIDAGNAVAHSICLKSVKWPDTKGEGRLPNDFVFWKNVYNFFNQECILTEESISVYNKLKKKRK